MGSNQTRGAKPKAPRGSKRAAEGTVSEGAAAAAPAEASAATHTAAATTAAPDRAAPRKRPKRHFDRTKMTAEQCAVVRKRLNVTIEGDAPPPFEKFEGMTLSEPIMRALTEKNYETPTPIQSQAIPVALEGHDILGCAETGSGKTCAFGLPLIQYVLDSPPRRMGDGPLAIVLAPTRELAQQIQVELRAFSNCCKGLRVAIVVGGAPMGEQRGELRAGVDVVVATPGRFNDHLEQRNTTLNRAGFIVLDEADRMLDMGFEPQIRIIMRNVPADHQTLLFSATMPDEIEELASEYLNKPVRVKVGQVSTPTANVTQSLVRLQDEMAKPESLLELVAMEHNQAEQAGMDPPLTIVFVERKTRADEMEHLLHQAGLECGALHGGRSQQDREYALKRFRSREAPILIATDVAARGLDVSGVAHVINLDLPRALEDYVHRIGRTGRGGATGRATSFYTDRDAFLVGQIKRAIAEVEAGNAFAFATGKSARAKEREEARAFREGVSTVDREGTVEGDQLRVTDMKHMKFAGVMNMMAGKEAAPAGAADDAWDD